MQRRVRSRRITLVVIMAVAAMILALLPATAGAKPKPEDDNVVDFWLTILHNNDGESQVINAGSGREDFGGAARFLTVLDDLRAEAFRGPQNAERGVVTLSSGDNFLAGPEFNASLANGVPFYDTIAVELIGYDAISFGNHDFDFGPDVTADFLDGYGNPPPYVAANMDFSGEPDLQAYVDSGVIAPTTIVMERGERIGVIGLQTPNLPFISSPRNVVVSDDLVNIVKTQVGMLQGMEVDKIILVSHLQNIANEIELIGDIEGVDVAIAGGGDELLANRNDLLIPGDETEVFGAYPQLAIDSSGAEVPVVTTSGEYRYVGQLVVGFNSEGEVVKIDKARSGPVRVATGDCNGTRPCTDAVVPNAEMQGLVVDPVEAYVAGLEATVIGQSEVALDGLRASVRSMETNEGNLIADSQRWLAERDPLGFGVPIPDVALQNGGGIRNNTIIPAGPISELDTFDMVPFSNFVTVVPDIPRQQFKEILENAVACTQDADFDVNPNCGSGRFAQVSGFSFEWSASGVGQILDGDGNVVTPGTRVLDVVLDNNTVIVSGGAVMPGADVNIATVDFLARGGDQYPFRGAPFTSVGVSYQQALSNYIQAPTADGGLNGLISTTDYPEGGEGRITELP